MAQKFDKIYQFKITLKDISPRIWRRIQVPETYTFWGLHVAIQDSMGWWDYHLHEFRMAKPLTGARVIMIIYNEGYEDMEEEILPCRTQKIAEYFTSYNRTADYVYDFGDDWEHTVKLEKIRRREDGVKYPICIDGKRACPPEDCGGIHGYADLLKILRNPKHEEYKETRTWVGRKFSPERFDIERIKFSDPERRWIKAVS